MLERVKFDRLVIVAVHGDQDGLPVMFQLVDQEALLLLRGEQQNQRLVEEGRRARLWLQKLCVLLRRLL